MLSIRYISCLRRCGSNISARSDVVSATVGKTSMGSPRPQLYSKSDLFQFHLDNIGNSFSRSSKMFSTHHNETPLMNLEGFRSEVDRNVYRTLKKLTNSRTRLSNLKSNMNVESSREIEIKEVELKISGLQESLNTIRNIATELKEVHRSDDPNLDRLFRQGASLGISDKPKSIQPRGPKKLKSQPPPSRLPYYSYMSVDGISIRVGRQSKDNDEISCNSEYRDDADWWMHVANTPGSHVVIRSQDDTLQTTFPETVIDAALLAVVNSKASTSKGRVKVNLTRVRNVSKPVGAKPGLVRLSGEIVSVTVDLRAETRRLQRLLTTKS